MLTGPRKLPLHPGPETRNQPLSVVLGSFRPRGVFSARRLSPPGTCCWLCVSALYRDPERPQAPCQLEAPASGHHVVGKRTDSCCVSSSHWAVGVGGKESPRFN